MAMAVTGVCGTGCEFANLAMSSLALVTTFYGISGFSKHSPSGRGTITDFRCEAKLESHCQHTNTQSSSSRRLVTHVLVEYAGRRRVPPTVDTDVGMGEETPTWSEN